MAHPNKAKGDRYERDVLALVKRAGFVLAERTRPGRREDQGDIDLRNGVVLQTKDVATPQWRDWLAQLAEQKANADAHTAALVVKRRGTGGRPPLHLAVMPLDELLELLQRLESS